MGIMPVVVLCVVDIVPRVRPVMVVVQDKMGILPPRSSIKLAWANMPRGTGCNYWLLAKRSCCCLPQTLQFTPMSVR